MEMPEKGFYYHYKRDPAREISDHVYEVLGVAQHSEDASNTVAYRPLYKDEYLKADFFNRPLEMFMEEVEKDGKKVKRFTKITDPDLIKKLEEIRDEMY